MTARHKLLVASSLASLPILLALGCESSRQALDVRRDHSDQRYTAHFDRAYFSQAADGQLDVILLSDPAHNAAVDRPLAQGDRDGVRQVVHVRVIWSDPRALRLDNPSSSNAMIQWHVVAGASDRLTYAGSCWVRADVDDDEAELDIRNAVVAIRDVVGQVDDPLKRATLEGSVTATRNDGIVRTYLSELATLPVKDLQTALSGPPARAPMTP
jgi:hypothetical protein